MKTLIETVTLSFIKGDVASEVKVKVKLKVKVKVKFNLEEATKAQRGGRSIALLFL